MKTLFLYSPVDSAVHRMHLDALQTYARERDVPCTIGVSRPGVGELLNRRGRTLVWSTGLWNLIHTPFARLRGEEVIYYLHEPSTLRTKIDRGNGWLKSLAWQAMQHFDTKMATTVLVSRQELAHRAAEVYGIKAAKVDLAPLILPPPLGQGKDAQQRRRITYLGRVDERRYLHEFLAQAPAFSARGFIPTVLTSNVDAIAAFDIDESVDVIAVPNFSEDQKAEVLNETILVWNPKSYSIAQSGVTVDALRYGCQIVLTQGDPECLSLAEAGIAVQLDETLTLDLDAVANSSELTEAAQNLFEQRYGSKAFDDHYLPLVQA